jgi:hypothetical protein
MERDLLPRWIIKNITKPRKGNDMVNMPLAPILPRHAGLELRFKMILQEADGTPDEFPAAT